METLMRKLTALCMLTGMLAQMFVTTLPAVGAGAEGSLPVLQGVAECKKADERQHLAFKEHKDNHYTGQYVYYDEDVPFSADLTCKDGVHFRRSGDTAGTSQAGALHNDTGR